MDRDYWRSEPTRRLIEEARSKGCELCIALGERLEAADGEIALAATDAEDRAIDNDIEISKLRMQIEELLSKIVDAEDTIEKLKGTK